MILQKAFELIYTKGYQTTSIDDIIATTQVTKGAFYYHFKHKDEMGVAIIEEVLKPTMQEFFVEPLRNSMNPVKDIYAMMKHLLYDQAFLKVEYGCPAANLTQEMTPWNKKFSEALGDLVSQWQVNLEACIRNGIRNGNIRKDINPERVAFFIMSGYWGIRNFGKLYNDSACYQSYLKELKFYLKQLE